MINSRQTIIANIGYYQSEIALHQTEILNLELFLTVWQNKLAEWDETVDTTQDNKYNSTVTD